MSPKRTIYVREADQDLWDRAEKLAEHERDSLSGVLAEALRTWVTQKESQHRGMERIELEVAGEYGRMRKVAFTGRWLVDRTAALAMGANIFHAVALTRQGRIATYEWHSPYPGRAELAVYDSLQDAQGKVPTDVLTEAARAMEKVRGEITEELDI